jgi:hypothetical protein
MSMLILLIRKSSPSCKFLQAFTNQLTPSFFHSPSFQNREVAQKLQSFTLT